MHIVTALPVKCRQGAILRGQHACPVGRIHAQKACQLRKLKVCYAAAAADSDAMAKQGEDAGEAAAEPRSPAEYKLNVLWLDKRVSISVDQVFNKGCQSPVTEYYSWPMSDAWEDLKGALEQRSWISERDRVLLLNKCTQVINYWQEAETRHTLDEARKAFPDVTFFGA